MTITLDAREAELLNRALRAVRVCLLPHDQNLIDDILDRTTPTNTPMEYS